MEYPKRPSHFSFTALSSVLLLFLSSALSSPFAANPESELKEIQKKLREEKHKVSKTIKKEKSVIDEIEQINRVLNGKRKELKQFNSKLAAATSKITAMEKEISIIDSEKQRRKKYLHARLRSIYKQQKGDIAFALISANDYHDLAKRLRYLEYLTRYDGKLIKDYSETVTALNSKRQDLELLQKELETHRTHVKKKTLELRKQRRQKDVLIASIRKKRETYENMIKELEKSSIKLKNIIRESEQSDIPYSVSGKGFMALKRRLPWPVNGSVIVPYGPYKDPRFKIPTFRKGIEIRADVGDTVLTVAGGRIVYADWFKGYGLLLIVNHGEGYHTLYGNLAETFHNSGDIIKRRQAIGKIGESGILNQPSLYFEIRRKGKPVDPLDWLRKK